MRSLMVGNINVTGSSKLKKSLPYGSLRMMANIFSCSEYWIGKVVSGAANGNSKIIECAEKLADVEFDARIDIKKILDEYRSVN